MNTKILRLTSRNVLKDIIIDFGVDSENFDTLKCRHEDEFEGLSFRQAKKLIITDVFSDKKQVEKYLKNNISDYNVELNSAEPYLGETFLKETLQLIEFLKSYIKYI